MRRAVLCPAADLQDFPGPRKLSKYRRSDRRVMIRFRPAGWSVLVHAVLGASRLARRVGSLGHNAIAVPCLLSMAKCRCRKSGVGIFATSLCLSHSGPALFPKSRPHVIRL